VVILGGGFCGTRIAKKLERNPSISTVLIDQKPFFEYTPSLYKIPTDTSYLSRIRRDFTDFLTNTELVTDEIIKVTPETVITKKQRFAFDFLIIATGIDYPIRLNNRSSVFTLKSSEDALQIASHFKDSNRILVIGGGLTGVELTAQIASKLKEKQIVLVHSKTRLLDRLPPRASKLAKRYLQQRCVQVILGERILHHENQLFSTNRGRLITADLGIWSAGISWNPSFMQEFPATVFTPNHALRTNQYLQLKGFPNIFVGGDLTGIPEEKTAQNAELHANLISTNVQRILDSNPIKPYHIKNRPILVSLGDWNGILSYGKIVIAGWLPALGKKFVEWWTNHQYS
jgi:NADH dehydrogenase FAD-containing subunit